MFSKKDLFFLVISGVLITAGYILMVIDPEANGFGIFTLWLAPPLLLIGFLLPVFAIIGSEILSLFSWHTLNSNRPKHIFGLLVFLIAFTTYLLTLEPTASLWDCSEFIASAYKLQVPHTPGAPLSLLVGRLFTMIAFGDISKVAWSLNLMSGLFSALTVSLVYYIIFYLGKKISGDRKHRGTTLILSSLCGSLCLTFSDSFWFSAVEAETYGAACFFLLLLLWLILTGKDLSEPFRSRRLILIFYLAGSGYCIHPMCLLALPVLPFAWYTDKKLLTLKNVVLSVSAGLAIVLIINRFVAIGLFELAFSFDLFFINYFHLPFYSGAALLFILVICSFILVLKKYKKQIAGTWALIFLLLGFIPYLMLFIRSNHNPPIDETNPENLSMIKAYMNRESYPSSPLLYGPYFDAGIRDIGVKKTIYFQGQSKYEVAGTMPEYHYDSRQTFLPRIYSNDASHIETYRQWTGLKEHEKPRFSHNLKFLFSYQLGHMYLRYLMWNFAGRESDAQGSAWLKPWERLSHSEMFERARNQYWMIPLLFGIAGISCQYRKDRKGFISVAIFFLITGLVLALYLNSTPNEPRERDYIYVGSYIAFCIWIGLGLLSLMQIVFKKPRGMIAAGVIGMSLPLWMLYQNYDDHDRSGRTFQVDNARNILGSCAPDAILFTGGDNDTFPLWYVQEVEGFRTDVRVMVLSYMNTDWYINQLRKTYYDSGAFKLTLDEKDYRQYGANDVLYVQESIKDGIDVKQYLQLLKNEHPALRRVAGNGEVYHILPSRILKISVDKKNLLVASGSIDHPEPESEIAVTISENYITKNMLAILDLIISNDWKRPVYFNFTSMNTLGVDLKPYLIQEGPLYRMTPGKNTGENTVVNTRLAYANLIEKADYDNLLDADVNFNYEDYYARMIVPIRQSFNALAASFLEEGNKEMAEKVLIEAMDKLYGRHLRASYTNLQAAGILMTLDKNDLAESFLKPAFDYYQNRINACIDDHTTPDDLDVYVIRQSAAMLAQAGKPEYIQKLNAMGM